MGIISEWSCLKLSESRATHFYLKHINKVIVSHPSQVYQPFRSNTSGIMNEIVSTESCESSEKTLSNAFLNLSGSVICPSDVWTQSWIIKSISLVSCDLEISRKFPTRYWFLVAKTDFRSNSPLFFQPTYDQSMYFLTQIIESDSRLCVTLWKVKYISLFSTDPILSFWTNYWPAWMKTLSFCPVWGLRSVRDVTMDLFTNPK